MPLLGCSSLPRASVRLAALLWIGLWLAGARAAEPFVCEHPPYQIQLVSRSPLVIYIAGFLTEQERLHLREITKDTFQHSGVHGGLQGRDDGSTPSSYRHSVRTSQSTNVPRDAVVRCIEDRALRFQGYDVPRAHLEPLQLVRYGAGEHYHFHTDWYPDRTSPASPARPEQGGDRATSFFAYVHVENGTTGGGTNFPLVDAPRDARWCDAGLVDCDAPWEAGVTFRPREGNAVFWQNLLPDGSGDPRTLHAGLPVTSGGKTGMNIWTRQAPLGEEVRGPDVEEASGR